MDPVSNFPYSFIEVPPEPADSGTLTKLRAGGASSMPRAGAFNAVIWKPGVIATRPISEIVRVSTITETTVAVGSNAAHLPQAIIHIADAGDFDPGGGTASIELTDGSITTIAYTGTSSGELTGCTGGVGTMHTGDRVTDDWINITREQENTNSIEIKKNWQVLAAITKKWFDDITIATTPPSVYVHDVNGQDVNGAFTVSDGNKFFQRFNSNVALPLSFLNADDAIPFPVCSFDELILAGAFDLICILTVMSLDYANYIKVECNHVFSSGIMSGSLDWTTATVLGTPVGTDLSLDTARGVVSAAGGIYAVYSYLLGEPD